MESPRALLVRSFVSDMERGAAYQSLPIPQPYPLEAPPISGATSSEDASRPKAQKRYRRIQTATNMSFS